MDRRSFLALSAALGLSPQAFAQANWPNGPVKLVAAFPPGGSVDAMARLAQPGLQERLAVPIVVENRGGASGAVGANVVAKSAPMARLGSSSLTPMASIQAFSPICLLTP